MLDISTGISLPTLQASVDLHIELDGTQGLPQFIQLGFSGRVVPKKLEITFQGGFVGRACTLYTLKEEGTKDWQKFAVIYAEDVNRAQLFDLIPMAPDILEGGIKGLKLIFEESTDFFGRITVYDLKLDGKHIPSQ